MTVKVVPRSTFRLYRGTPRPDDWRRVVVQQLETLKPEARAHLLRVIGNCATRLGYAHLQAKKARNTGDDRPGA